MIEKDFIKREINQLGVALRKILSELIALKSNGNFNQGIEVSQSALKTELAIDLDRLKNRSSESLIQFLTKEKRLRNTDLETLAKILFEISKKEKDEQSALTTLNILNHLDRTDRTYSLERQEMIDLLRQKIN